MWKLIKLEWKRNHISRVIRSAVIMTVVLLVFIMVTAGEAGADVAMRGFFHKSFINASVELFTHMSYMVFTGVMLGVFIVGEYEKGTIRLLFSYPIKRRKIMLSKILAVWIFNFAALIISKLLMYAVVLATGSFIHVPVSDIPYGYWLFWAEIFLSSAAMISISFLALPVGMLMKSSRATIVTAVIIVCFTQGNIGEFTLANSVPFYAVLFVLAVFSVFLAMYRIVGKDV